MLSGITELKGYKEVYDKDQEIVETLAPYINELGDKKNVAIIGLDITIPDKPTIQHTDHILGATANQWGITGAYRAHINKYIVPVLTCGAL